MAEYKNILLQNGSPISGVQVRLYNDSNQKKGADSTTWEGKYEFTNIVAGNYQVRFFGEDFTEDDWLYITVTGPGGELASIEFSGTPILTVVETSYDYELQGEISVAQATLTNLEVSAGKLSSILIKFKLSSESTWEILNKFDFGDGLPNVATDLSNVIYTSDIPLKEKPSSYDFRATYFNGDGIPAKTIGGALLVTNETSITFNGIPDIAEYVGVENVTVKNSNAAGDRIPTNIIMLEWEHPETTGAGNFTDAAGSTIAVSADQVKNVNSFVVYMFISNDGAEPDDGFYPASSPTNGTWYVLDTLAADTTFTSIRLPQKKQVMVWIGFTTPGVITSATTEMLNF